MWHIRVLISYNYVNDTVLNWTLVFIMQCISNCDAWFKKYCTIPYHTIPYQTSDFPIKIQGQGHMSHVIFPAIVLVHLANETTKIDPYHTDEKASATWEINDTLEAGYIHSKEILSGLHDSSCGMELVPWQSRQVLRVYTLYDCNMNIFVSIVCSFQF